MPVILALNTLLERVNQLLQGERRFIADAAHELRTPIAGLRAQAQAALGATSPAERKHALLSTLQGCDRASHLVQQLLTLSRIDAALPEPLQANVDLEGLVRGVALSLAPTALAAGQCLELETATAGPGQQRLAGVRSAQPAPVLIKGVDALLRVLVRNLIENALRYGSTGVTVRVRVASLPTGFISLSVEDSGPGLSATDLARLGERFFRALGNASTGSGLGWSIVQRIAQVHGAEIHAESPGALGGLSVHVSFPTT
jgi:two-component system sensor histidine kinase QseC